MPFKVIQGHRCRYQSTAGMRLPTNWHTIPYRFEVIGDYCSNFGRKTVTLRFDPPF